ncbi:MAG: hypothetical protein WCK58_07475 [Chloroflexota bacterium]
MTLGRTVAIRVTEIRLEQARSAMHRAQIDFLRADLLDSDCTPAARSAQRAQARAREIEADLRRLRAN